MGEPRNRISNQSGLDRWKLDGILCQRDIWRDLPGALICTSFKAWPLNGGARKAPLTITRARTPNESLNDILFANWSHICPRLFVCSLSMYSSVPLVFVFVAKWWTEDKCMLLKNWWNLAKIRTKFPTTNLKATICFWTVAKYCN